jgi:signal-transduction protein with cAMP-binding, CBS, and nucleotidyltransferase domain
MKEIWKWMSENLVVVEMKDSLLSAVRKMSTRDIGAILVMDKDKLIGIFSERDMLRFFAAFNPSDLEQPIEKFMSKNPICAQKDEDFDVVHMKMKVNNIRHIPIMDGEALVGIVSLRDLTQSYQYKIESDLLIARKEIQELQGLAKGTDNEKIENLIAKIRSLEELSLTDFLTGLYNARYFQIRLEEEIARAERYHSRFSLIFGDIDLFKLINDRFGHKYGDEVLKQIARILIESVGGIRIISRLRKSDIVARYGGNI